MYLDSLKVDRTTSNAVLKTSYTRLVPVKKVVDGVVVSTSTYEEFNHSSFCENLVSSDFDIANILEIGNLDVLKPTYVSTMSDMNFADKFQNINIPSNVQKV